MPLLSARETTGTVRRLDSQTYSDTGTGAIGGVGLTREAYEAMNQIVSAKRANLNALEKLISDHIVPVDGGRAHHPFQVDNRGRKAVPGSQALQIQSRGAALADVNAAIRNRVPLADGANARFTPQDEYYGGALDSYNAPNKLALKPEGMNSLVDLQTVTFEVQSSARRMFTAGQQISLSKMIAEWLTLVTDLIQCASDAEKDLEKVVGDINAERQAIWSLVGGVVGGVLTYSVPPPAGAIIGAVVMAVCTEDTWLKCIASGAKLGVQANTPVAHSSSTLGPATIQTIYGQEKISDFKDWFAVIGGATSCLGKNSKEVAERINKKTIRHLTDMPTPPKDQSKDAASVIRKECKDKVQAVLRAVGEEISDFVNTQSGPASLVQASWEFQAAAITGKAKLLPAGQQAMFVRDRIKEGCELFLNTVAHEILITMAQTAKPNFNRFTINSKEIKKQFEILFWATYLATSALKDPKAATSSGAKRPQADSEDYFAFHYGTIKKLVWRNQVETKLNELGITKQFAAPSRLPFAGKSDAYKEAIRNWRPPMPTGTWMPVPYQEGGTNAKGRLAAWAIEYVNRTPVELFRAIMP